MIRRHLQFSVLHIAALLTALVAVAIPARADATLPALLADHMVIQRGSSGSRLGHGGAA